MRTALQAAGARMFRTGDMGWGGEHEHADEGGEAAREPAERARFRTVFISDLHLGTAGCQAGPLLDFLKHHPSQTLYLVGDIIDGWQLKRRWFWPQAHNDVVQKLLRRSRKGCRVVYVPGNHDEFARQFCGHRFGGIEVAEEAVHTTADGRKLWVVHGDHFDGVIQCAKWLAYLGDNAYEFTLRLNRHLNSMRARLGLPYWSLSQYLKHKVKSALNYVTDFERAVAAEARQRGYQGVVCGHIHRPEMRVIDGTLYCNDGDWVESLSALVEHFDGQLELVRWRPSSESGRKQDEHDLERDPGASPTRDECVTQTSRARSIIVTYERKLPPPEASPA